MKRLDYVRDLFRALKARPERHLEIKYLRAVPPRGFCFVHSPDVSRLATFIPPLCGEIKNLKRRQAGLPRGSRAGVLTSPITKALTGQRTPNRNNAVMRLASYLLRRLNRLARIQELQAAVA